MPEFIMDRDGVVNGMEFRDLSDIFQGYIEAMLFTETCGGISMVDWDSPEVQEDVAEGRADGNIPGDSGWGDIHPESAERAQLDCLNFQTEAARILEAVAHTGYDRTQAGRDFWFTRNGHGVGFWDRKELEGDAWEAAGSPRVGDAGWDAYLATREGTPGRMLTEIAKGYGEVYVSFEPDPDSPTGYGYVHLS